MLRVERTTVVNTPVEKVFNHLADFSCYYKWFCPPFPLRAEKIFTGVERVSSGTIGKGSTLKFSVYFTVSTTIGPMWAIRQAGIFVVDLAQNERLAFDIIWPNARKRDRIAFEVRPCRDSTQITEQRELIRSPVWYWPFVVLLSPVIYLWRLVVIRSQILDDLRALKFWMEVMLSNKANAADR